jgi:signal transduction histidine kinase
VGQPADGRQFTLAVALLVVLALAFVAMGRRPVLSESLDVAALNASLAAMTALLAAVVAAMSILRWRITGEATSLRVGFAVALLGLASATEVVALVMPNLDAQKLPLILQPVASLLALAGFAIAYVGAEVNTRLSPRRMLVSTLGAMVAGVAVMRLVPALTHPLDGDSALSAGTGGPTVARLVVFAGLGALGVVYTWRGLQTHRWLHTWIGLMLFAIALSTGALLLVERADDPYLMGAALLAIFGLAFALNGGARELAAAYTEQRALRFNSETRVCTAESGLRAERAAHEELAHDAQSALAAVHAALRVLEHQSSSLDRAARGRLVDALEAEVGRLRELFAGAADAQTYRAFRLRDAVTPVATLRAAAGTEVFEDIPDDIWSFGSPTAVAEIVDNLLGNAQRHAPGSPVWLRACQYGGTARLWVEDRGPGVPLSDQKRIFERGATSERHAHEGAGLGLFVAQRLARAQGGELWVENSAEGGAAFVLRLPAAYEAARPEAIAEFINSDDDPAAEWSPQWERTVAKPRRSAVPTAVSQGFAGGNGLKGGRR